MTKTAFEVKKTASLRRKSWVRLCIGSCHCTGSRSSPDEDRLLKHMFHHDHQPHNLLTTPIANINGTISITVGIGVSKIIAVVKSKVTFAYHYLLKSVDCMLECSTLSITLKFYHHNWHYKSHYTHARVFRYIDDRQNAMSLGDSAFTYIFIHTKCSNKTRKYVNKVWQASEPNLGKIKLHNCLGPLQLGAYTDFIYKDKCTCE